MNPSRPLSERHLDVLVIDDEAGSRARLANLVRDLGHTCVDCTADAAALEAARAMTPDLVVLTWSGQDESTLDLLDQVRHLCGPRGLPAIVHCEAADDERIGLALWRGADDVVRSPVQAEVLAAKLRQFASILSMQADMAASGQRQRDMLDNIPDAVLTLDGDGKVNDANLAACRQFGDGTPHQVVGARVQHLFGHDLDALLSGRELTLVRSNGLPFPAEIGASEWLEGQARRVTVIIRDLTQQRTVERMKDEFLATVSHELRTPLTSILGALGLLAGGAAGQLPAPAQQLADVARRNGERLGRLIDDLLDLTKMEGDRLVLSTRPLRVFDLLGEAISANAGYAQRAGVRLLSTSTSESQVVDALLDADRFLQVMANLLSNAIKHSPPGGTVQVSVELRGAAISISVKDDGPGIDPAFRTRMFEKFSQADGSDRRALGGTGLGLYITRMLVERMGGNIQVDAAASHARTNGTKFVIDFPVLSANKSADSPRIFHIDRDADARRRVQQWLAPFTNVRSVASLMEFDPSDAMAPHALVIADPQAQGPADEFCAELRTLAGGGQVMLYSDSIDQSFAQKMNMAWLRKARMSQRDFQDAIGLALRQRKTEGSPP